MLLAEAGLKDTDEDGIQKVNRKLFAMKLEVLSSRRLKEREISHFVACFRVVGVHVEVIPMEWSVFLARRRKDTLAPLNFRGFYSAFGVELDLGVGRTKA